ncbi:GNAT family N-acetyltransferase [Mycobacteroides chelonae]|uniref:GNAT family N-acetyltransferase n=1 Tax=Mycobacteroides chelonae TaxID=1774 RepID=UPI0008A90648|nr:N-acetyltransferase [Mycobacteroides chelonae]OHT78578.1 GNAT family N-acetyltransferase [Mycobacteroides chelonae]
MTTWTTRAELPEDVSAIRAVNIAAFPAHDEAELVDALRADPAAWIDGLSTVSVDTGGEIVAHSLLTRCTVGAGPALALGPCAVLPRCQRTGAGSAAIRASLEHARSLGENLIVVLGHALYYPRFGFTPASAFGVSAGFDVTDDTFLALALDPQRETPRGQIVYPAAFGV